MDKTDVQIADINKRHEKNMLSGDASTEKSLPIDQSSNGIIRRIFGSNSSVK
jgi:hypothetical protein